MDLTKLNKKIPLKVHFSALKLYNFNFIAFHVSCNVQMHTSCHKKAKLKIMPFQPLCIARGQRALKIAYMNKQQTPKPDAHVPDALPPFVPQ